MSKDVKTDNYTLLFGDCLERMKEIPDGSVNLTVTSPPYDNLRTYKDSLVWNEHIWKDVLRELYRTTKDGGVLVWVVGDSSIGGGETGTSFKQALYAMECGFTLNDTMIYQKPNRRPRQYRAQRYEQCFEYMFVFLKGKEHVYLTKLLSYVQTQGSRLISHLGMQIFQTVLQVVINCLEIKQLLLKIENVKAMFGCIQILEISYTPQYFQKNLQKITSFRGQMKTIPYLTPSWVVEQQVRWLC